MEEGFEPETSLARHVLHNLGFFGHYLHMHAGGRSGKQHMLVKLLAHDGHLTQRELQESFSISSAALSEVLAKLEGEGLVTRTRSSEDRRQLEIALTAEGRVRAVERVRQKQEFEQRAFSCLSDEELQLLSGLLDRIVSHWESFGRRGDQA